MRTNWIILFVALCACGISSAQHVKDPAYALLLGGLLSDDVPFVDVNNMDPEAVILLDAREREEFDVSHIEGARWVGYDDFDLSRVKDIPNNSAIVVYCSVGYRSEKITVRMRTAGWTKVKNLYGGIFEWVNVGQEVVDEQGATTRIHGYDTVWSRWLSKGEVIH